MRRARARLLACTVVLLAAASAAYASFGFVVTSSTAASNPDIPIGSGGRIVFSVRNPTGGMVQITNITPAPIQMAAGKADGCTGTTVTPMAGSYPVWLQAGQQVQFVATATSFPVKTEDTDFECLWDIQTNPTTTPPLDTVRTSFRAVLTPMSGFDVQPAIMSLVPTSPTGEQQNVIITNYNTTQAVNMTINNDPMNHLAFEGACTGHTCNNQTIPGSGMGSSVVIRCAQPGSTVSAVLDVRDTSNQFLGSASLVCSPPAAPATIDIMEATIAISAMQGQLGSNFATVVTMDTGQLGSASVFSSDPSMKLEYCDLATCSWSPPESLPYQLFVVCTPGAFPTSGTLMVHEVGGAWAMANVTCTSSGGAPEIEIMDNNLDITGPAGVEGSASTMVYSPGMNTTMSFASVNTGYGIDLCGGASMCALIQSLPTPLTVTCTPGVSPSQATLYVEEPGGDSDMAIVYCTPETTSAPGMSINPTTMNFGMQQVNTTMMQMLTITNTGDVPLSNILISIPASPHWTATNCTTATNPCSLQNKFDTVTAQIQFHPTSHGNKGTMATVTSMETAMPLMLDLIGTGSGGVMSVTNPAYSSVPPIGHHLELGRIPRGQTTMKPITVQNSGNAAINAIVQNWSAPYSVSPATSTTVNPNNGTQDFVVTCGSSTASENNDQVFEVRADDAYSGSPVNVTAHCSIANTLVQVDPLVFDFGEVRTNGGPMTKTITVTVTNPGPANAVINSMQLSQTIPGLTLTPAMTSATLGANENRTAMMALTNTADVDLDGQSLDINVDGEMLELPVTGRVVTASSRIVPQRELDLGTACVGTQVSGNVMLINDGTATLAVQAPVMNEAFIAMAPPASTLPPSESLTATILPAASAVGQISGKLSWADDVPNNHEIDVVLDYVDSGTALSPRALDFGFVEVGLESELQRIKLQNCDLERATIKVESLRTKRGPLAAWIIEPQVGYQKLLDGRQEQSINVKFVPPGRGVYEATLTIATQSGKQTVTLRGDATGKDFDATSFYACACNGPGAPSRGWPVVLAVVLVIARRRRGPSSTR